MPGFQHSATLLNDNHNNNKAKRQLISATSLCFVFMVIKRRLIILCVCVFYNILKLIHYTI